MKFTDLSTTKKGDLGELIFDNHLRGKNYIPYKPDEDCPHPFDRIYASRDMRKMFLADIKAKSCRKYFPDTGIDIKHYDRYIYVREKYGLQFYICFADEEEGMLYGGKLSDLEKIKVISHKGRNIKYPIKSKGIIYFPRAAMKNIARLTFDEIARLKDLTTKNQLYTG